MNKRFGALLLLVTAATTATADHYQADVEQSFGDGRFDFPALLGTQSGRYAEALLQDLRNPSDFRHSPLHVQACDEGAALVELLAKARCLGAQTEQIQSLLPIGGLDETAQRIMAHNLDKMLHDVFTVYANYPPARIEALWHNRCVSMPPSR